MTLRRKLASWVEVIIVIIVGIGLASVIIYYFAVLRPEREAYCMERGWKLIIIDRSWACRDPKTGQLFR